MQLLQSSYEVLPKIDINEGTEHLGQSGLGLVRTKLSRGLSLVDLTPGRGVKFSLKVFGPHFAFCCKVLKSPFLLPPPPHTVGYYKKIHA